MKVLKFKKAKYFKVKEKCIHCGAVLEIEPSDVEGRAGPFGFDYHFTCLMCEHYNTLNDKNALKYLFYQRTKDIKEGEQK